MPRTRSAEVAYRDELISQEAGEGIPRREIARKYGITEARVSQIVLAHHEEISTDAARAESVALLEFGLEKAAELLRMPPQRKVSPSGKMVFEPLLDENGEILRNNRGIPLDDPSKPVYDYSHVTEALKQLPPLLDRKSKFMGLDLKAPKEKDESAEYAAQLSWVQGVAEANQAVTRENEELRARLAALERGGVEDAEIVTHDETPFPGTDVHYSLPPELSTPDLRPQDGQ
jgi:hypothetical protein